MLVKQRQISDMAIKSWMKKAIAYKREVFSRWDSMDSTDISHM